MLCGRRPCRLLSSDQGQRWQSCPAGQECLEHSYLTCFSQPCHEWGVCSMAGPSLPLTATKCQPNSRHLDNSCGRITLVFNRDKVPPVSNLFIYPPPHCRCVILDRQDFFSPFADQYVCVRICREQQWRTSVLNCVIFLTHEVWQKTTLFLYSVTSLIQTRMP